MATPSNKLLATVKDWYVLSKYEELLEDLHRDIQADIRDYWDGNDYSNGLSNADLMVLMKDWAYDKGYFLQSGTKHTASKYKYGCTITSHKHKVAIYNTRQAHTEFETIVVSCEWILSNDSN